MNLVSKVTDITAQTSTNVKSLERTSATRTPYARTRKDLMSVGVLEVLKAMEETAHLFCLHVLHLADQMHFANKAATGPSVPAIWASKATETTAQIRMNVPILTSTTVIPTPCVLTPRDLSCVVA